MAKKLDAQVIGVYGRRGTGKTTRIKNLIEKRKRVIVLDPKGEYPNPVAWDDLGQVIQGREYLVSYRPKYGTEIEVLDRLSRALLKNRTGRICLVVDELQKFAPQRGMPPGMNGFIQLVQEGRHADVEIIGATQRPATVQIDFRGNAEVSYILGLSWQNDVDVICQMIGREFKDRLKSLEVHEFLRFEGGQVTSGRNVLK